MPSGQFNTVVISVSDILPLDKGHYISDNEFMATMSEVYMALQEAGFEPFDQLTGYVRTGNDQYITRRHNARKIVTEMDPELIKQYLKRYGHMYVVRK